MIFNIPSWAYDYEFIVCSLSYERTQADYWSVETNGWKAEEECEAIRKQGLEPIIIHNVRIQGKRSGKKA